MAYALNRFVLPDMCCMCLGRAELMHKLSTPYGEGGRSGFIEFEVPICRNCRSRAKKQTAIAAAILLTMLAAGAYVIWRSGGEPSSWFDYLAGASATVGALGLFALGLSGGMAPAVHKGDRLIFTNKEYHRLFEDANRPPS